jgi:hypothetical protein
MNSRSRVHTSKDIQIWGAVFPSYFRVKIVYHDDSTQAENLKLKATRKKVTNKAEKAKRYVTKITKILY